MRVGHILGSGARLMPLITIERLEDAVPLAQALVDGGLMTMEVALRTPAAPQAIREILRHVPEAVPVAGNVLTPHDLAIASHVGAKFAVSPVSPPALLDAAGRQVGYAGDDASVTASFVAWSAQRRN